MPNNSFFTGYESPLGYKSLNNGYDSYGVDHSNFTTRDELNYQYKRLQREKELMQQQNNMGILDNYTKYTTNFWGTSPENNYGFGTNNVEPSYWEKAKDGKNIYENVVAIEGNPKPQSQNPINYVNSAINALGYMYDGQNVLSKEKLKDKFKHAFLNCKGAQYGSGGYDMARLLSDFKEAVDLSTGSNTLDASQADNYANKIGRLLGTKYPNDDCDTLLQKYIKKY